MFRRVSRTYKQIGILIPNEVAVVSANNQFLYVVVRISK